MERLYDMEVQVGGYNRSRTREIKDALRVEWSFRDEDFSLIPGNDGRSKLLRASALGTLLDGEDIDDIVSRIEHAVWRGNETPCHVEVLPSLVRTNLHETELVA